MKARDFIKRLLNIQLFHSLLIKYFLIIAAIVIVPISLLSVVYYGYYNQSLAQELESSNKYTALKVRDMTDMVFGEIRQLLVQICISSELEQVVSYNSSMFPDYNSIYRYNTLLDSFDFKSITSDYIESISVYSIPNDYVFSTLLGGSESAYYRDNEWIPRAVENAGVTEFYIEARTSLNTEVLSCYGYAPMNQNYKNGIVSININVNNLQNLITTINDNYFERIIIADRERNVILNTVESGDAYDFYSGALDVLEQQGTDSSIIQYQGIRYVVAAVNSEFAEFSFLFATPVDVYEQKLRSLREFMIIAMMLGIVFSLALAYFMSLKVYEPIRTIRSLIDNDTTLTAEYKKNRTDEYNYIIDNIKQSFKLSDDINKELRYRLELLDKAKAAALQSHINPHFLCNTLETVNFMALRKFGDDNEISRMVVSLSSLLRQSLETENAFTTLRDEIDHTREYVAIQKVRYSDRFDVTWNVDEECLPCRVIKIMLQPLLENALYHGIKPMTGKGRVTVTAFLSGTLLIVKVADNGVGMDPEAMVRLNSDLHEEYIQRNHHIGLMNVNQRVKLLFGELYGLNVSKAVDGHGVIVTLTLPVIREE